MIGTLPVPVLFVHGHMYGFDHHTVTHKLKSYAFILSPVGGGTIKSILWLVILKITCQRKSTLSQEICHYRFKAIFDRFPKPALNRIRYLSYFNFNVVIIPTIALYYLQQVSQPKVYRLYSSNLTIPQFPISDSSLKL